MNGRLGALHATAGLLATIVLACGSPFHTERRGAEPVPSLDPQSRPSSGEHSIGDGAAPSPSIARVQGRDERSPYEGDFVVVTGVVTDVLATGCFIETPDAEQDRDLATSEGVFVYTSVAPDVHRGDLIRVAGTVSEYGPDLPRTEITQPVVEVLAHGEPLPRPVALHSIPDTVESAIRGLESLEGMRVEVPNGAVVGALHGSILTLVADGAAASSPRTISGGLRLTENDVNPERIAVDVSAVSSAPLDVGAELTGAVTGVLDYRSGRYLVLADGAWPAATPTSFEPRGTTLAGDDAHWTVATFNAENLSPTDRAHLRAVAKVIADDLRSPDVVALEEVQDQNGTATGELSSAGTLDALCAAIAGAGGAEYSATDVAPAAENADGGAPGGNIRVAYLWRPDRVAMTLRGTADANEAVTITNDHGRAHLSPLPGRVEAGDPAFVGSRKPLVAEFTRGAERLITIAVHLSSRLGDDPIFGAVQPPRSPSSELRRNQAEVVAGFVERIQAVEPAAPVIVLGDFNDDEWSPALAALANAPLTDVTALLPASAAYSYVYEGNAQLFDHVLVSRSLAARTEVGVVHVNADFADVRRASDHDPVVARIASAP